MNSLKLKLSNLFINLDYFTLVKCIFLTFVIFISVMMLIHIFKHPNLISFNF